MLLADRALKSPLIIKFTKATGRESSAQLFSDNCCCLSRYEFAVLCLTSNELITVTGDRKEWTASRLIDRSNLPEFGFTFELFAFTNAWFNLPYKTIYHSQDYTYKYQIKYAKVGGEFFFRYFWIIYYASLFHGRC